ncbi:hypothetical protein J2128_001267 [Methanomicrobium sp. W14]|nr:hypothetical protein [Methanomicrobium sp. W14]MBP2133313.1 hypothetical protein [Methanomicrobium sp. W14]
MCFRASVKGVRNDDKIQEEFLKTLGISQETLKEVNFREKRA